MFTLGAYMGSYLNLYLIRTFNNIDLNRPCTCIKCGTTLKWYDNIPILGWFILKGRCRYCDCKLEIKYITHEVFGGLIGLLIFYMYS